MAKWGLFGAHRYLEYDSGPARLFGPDGRPLRRPWRHVDDEVATRVRMIRGARLQPTWPRLLGVAMVLLASVVALRPVDPIHPIPRHVAASSSARTGSVPLRLETVSPAGVIGDAPGHFVWRSASPDEPVTLVLLDAGYVELARVPGMVGCRGDVPDDVTRRLLEASTFHWFVEAAAAAGVVRSALQTCEIR